eukprot:273777_1
MCATIGGACLVVAVGDRRSFLVGLGGALEGETLLTNVERLTSDVVAALPGGLGLGDDLLIGEVLQHPSGKLVRAAEGGELAVGILEVAEGSGGPTLEVVGEGLLVSAAGEELPDGVLLEVEPALELIGVLGGDLVGEAVGLGVGGGVGVAGDADTGLATCDGGALGGLLVDGRGGGEDLREGEEADGAAEEEGAGELPVLVDDGGGNEGKTPDADKS